MPNKNEIDKGELIKALEGRKKPGRTKRKIKRSEAEIIADLNDKKFKMRTGYTKKGILAYEDSKAKRKSGYMAIRDFGGSPELAKKHSHKGERSVKESYQAIRDLGGSPDFARQYFHLGKGKIKKEFRNLPSFVKKSKEKRGDFVEKSVRIKREKKWGEWSSQKRGEDFGDSMKESVKYVNGMVGRPKYDSYGFAVMKQWYVMGGKIKEIMKNIYPEENNLDFYLTVNELSYENRKTWSNEIDNIFNNDYNLKNSAAALLDVPATKIYHKEFLEKL